MKMIDVVKLTKEYEAWLKEYLTKYINYGLKFDHQLYLNKLNELWNKQVETEVKNDRIRTKNIK